MNEKLAKRVLHLIRTTTLADRKAMGRGRVGMQLGVSPGNPHVGALVGTEADVDRVQDSALDWAR